MHDRCIAMLANYGAVQKEVESFYCENKELVLKISDYIAQWEEKSKLPKDSPKANSKSFIKKASENSSLEKPNKQELAGSKKSKLKTSVKTISKTNKSNVVSEVSNNAENINLNAEKLNISIDDMHKSLTVENSNIRKPVRIKERKESNENNSMSDEETDSNEENPFKGNDSDKEINNNVLNGSNDEAENSSDEESNVDETYKSESNSNSPIKVDKSKNKLKAIALLNLNELEGLDEIPVSNSFKNDESDEKESSEDEMSDMSQDKNIDPFFLGHNKDDSSRIQDDSSKNSDTDMRAKGSNNFKHEIQGVKKPSFPRKNDQFSHKNSFQQSLYNEKRDSKLFKRNADKSFNRNHKPEKQNSFVKRDYKTFERGNFNKNSKDFKSKNKPFPSHDSFDKKPFKNIPK